MKVSCRPRAGKVERRTGPVTSFLSGSAPGLPREVPLGALRLRGPGAQPRQTDSIAEPLRRRDQP